MLVLNRLFDTVMKLSMRKIVFPFRFILFVIFVFDNTKYLIVLRCVLSGQGAPVPTNFYIFFINQNFKHCHLNFL